MEDSEIYASFGPNDDGVLEKFIPGRLDQTLPYFLDCYEQFHAQCTQVFPGIDQVFTILQAKRMRTAIVTGKGAQSAAISMRVLGLDRWVDTIESGFAYGADKPRSIGLVLRRWGLPPGQAAYAGDVPSDIQAARQAGVLPVGAAWAETSTLRADPISQDYPTFYDVDCFIRWLEQIK